ncbi:MAG: nickel pincer cofactor biosynthesis protein LarC [Lachnospiraceae bacterium]|nr:nickel pincer cofactor biosynthesis protein LarC [Lachnospiraceae bacterium]
MKTLYLDLGMGAAGDMLTAALLELIDEPDEFVERFNRLWGQHIIMKRETAQKCGITGTSVRMFINGEEEEGYGYTHTHSHNEHYHEHAHSHEHSHHHTTMGDIEEIVESLPLRSRLKDDIVSVYNIIAKAESEAHNVPVTEIHFHEVGNLDAIADVTAVCMLMDEINPDKVVASAVHVGSGTVECAHGTLPVPAPATANILRGIPMYGGSIKGELCTPTGAALLKYFVNKFGDMPAMSAQKIGYGMGKKDFTVANCIRVFVGEEADKSEKVYELSTNVDDMTAEEISFACERLFEAGAFEVYTIAVGMKKGRPGTMIRALCNIDKKEAIIKAFFKHTSTIGIREVETTRYILERKKEEFNFGGNVIRNKLSMGYGATKSKLEYEDVAKYAKDNDVSISEARQRILKIL